MSASCSFADSDKLLLRWSEDSSSPSREEFVQRLETGVSEAVICSSRRVLENTEVSLTGKYSTQFGVVRSCRPAGGKFIVTIVIHSQTPKPPDIDPGVMLVDRFMTEEQEQRILDEIDEELENQKFSSLVSCCEGTAALTRFLKSTVRSSPAVLSNSVVHCWGKFRHVTGTRLFRAAHPSPAPARVERASLLSRFPGGQRTQSIQ